MAKLRFGVVGVGVMGARHARAVAALGTATLAAVADIDLSRAQALADELGARPFPSAEALVDSRLVDAVIVATDDRFHVQPVRAAAAAGLPVLLEKPIATTVAQAEEIVTIAEQADVPLMLGHILRFDPRYQAVRSAAVTGQLGDLVHLWARRNATVPSGQRLQGRASVTVFQGVHDIDMLHWITGQAVVRVSAEEVRRVHQASIGVADTVLATLRFADGAIAGLEMSWALPTGYPWLLDGRLEVVGTRGAAMVDTHDQGVQLFSDGRFTLPDTTYGEPSLAMLRNELAEFVSAIHEERPPSVTGRDGLAAVRVACAIDEAARLGQSVDLGVPTGVS